MGRKKYENAFGVKIRKIRYSKNGHRRTFETILSKSEGKIFRNFF